jgi:hypothetical protein
VNGSNKKRAAAAGLQLPRLPEPPPPPPEPPPGPIARARLGRVARPEPRRPRAACPECTTDLEDVLMTCDLGTHYICPGCAAILIVGHDLKTRSPLTHEWVELFCMPGYHHVFEDRDRMLDRITKPPEDRT